MTKTADLYSTYSVFLINGIKIIQVVEEGKRSIFLIGNL
jgi:hypothetical protein